MDDITQLRAACWRQRLRKCLKERGLTQVEFVSALNRTYLTRFHQKDVSRWLNTGNQTANGVIGFPKYETMMLIADFLGVDVGYLTGETDETSFDLEKASSYTGLSSDAILSIRQWIDSPDGSPDAELRDWRADTINRLFFSSYFDELAAKMLTLYEMSTICYTNPERFQNLMRSLAASSDMPNDLTFQLIIGAFYGMANESFSALLKDAYPTPTEQQFEHFLDAQDIPDAEDASDEEDEDEEDEEDGSDEADISDSDDLWFGAL